jgi:hypothetical protein
MGTWHVTGGCSNNKARELDLQMRGRQRRIQRFGSLASAQRAPCLSLSPVYNTFNVQRHLISRDPRFASSGT